jgi:hypothetical protein
MPYTLTQKDFDSITDAEKAFGTMRLLAEEIDIPEEFLQGNDYTALTEALYHGGPVPNFSVRIKDGFRRESLSRAIRAHLKSFEPSHKHKIAGVAFMISMAAEVGPATNSKQALPVIALAA